MRAYSHPATDAILALLDAAAASGEGSVCILLRAREKSPLPYRLTRLLDELARGNTFDAEGRYYMGHMPRRILSTILGATVQAVSHLMAEHERKGNAGKDKYGRWWKTCGRVA